MSRKKSELKKFYITTSIAYANASPHIGYAMEVLQADVLARYYRLRKKDVFFLSGTDEHGLKIKKAAAEKGMDIRKFVDENSAKFQLLLDTLNVSNDDFIRTSDKIHHWPAAQKLWEKLVEAGDIYKATYEGLYCVGCEAYLTEKDLIDGKCPNHQKEPEKIKEENYFFKLSKYSQKITEKIEKGEMDIFPEARKNEILNVLKSGLKDISFSRSGNILDWGIPIPGDKTQTMYVWCDALSNYISALGYGTDSDKFKKYWPADVHLIGKDILRFHAAIWPAMLMSAGLALPKKIFVHGYVTSGGQKMSKSLGNVIDPFEVVGKYGVDATRYYLLREISSGGDGDFSFERFRELYQADLANGIGNFTARILAMTESYFGGNVPNAGKEEVLVPLNAVWKNFPKKKVKLVDGVPVKELWDVCKVTEVLMERFEINKILSDIVIRNIGILDGYIDHYKPFKLIKTDKEKTAAIIYTCLESIRIMAWMIWPFMPETSDKIFAQLFADEEERKKELEKDFRKALVWGGLKPGTKIKKGENLFPRLLSK